MVQAILILIARFEQALSYTCFLSHLQCDIFNVMYTECNDKCIQGLWYL